MLINLPKECPVCKGNTIALVRQIPTETAGLVDLFYCLNCESFCSPFAKSIAGSTLNHHKSIIPRNYEWSKLFYKNLLAASGVEINRVIDVGCGIGTMLYAFKQEFDVLGIGYDLCKDSIDYGKKEFGLDLRAEIWTSENINSGGGEVDCITCIMVLEHLKFPRPLVSNLVVGARNADCLLYISVPFFNRDWWKYLRLPIEAGSPLHWPWDHVTHFSDKGFELLLKQLQVKSYKKIHQQPWAGYLIQP